MKRIIAIFVLSLIGFNVSANDNAKRLTELLIKDDISFFKKGNKSLLNNFIPAVKASQLISEYENNQYKYEKTYDKQLVNIKAVASGVKTDLSGDPYVVVNGKNQFEYISLDLKNKDDVVNINKGSKLDLICVGTKNNVIFPILKNCVTTDSYFQKFLGITMSKISNLKIDDVPNNFYEAIYIGLLAFDTKKPNELDKYKTANELFKNKADFNEIMAIAKSMTTKEMKKIIIPKP